MNCLTRYISWQLLIATLSVITVLTCVIWLAQSLRFVELVASKGVTIGIFLQMIFYLLPNLIVIVIPVAVLTAVMFIYNKLIMDHEFIVMQAIGFSFWQLSKPAILIATLFSAIMYVFTLYILPVSNRNFRDIEWSLKQEKSVHILQAGQFTSFGKYTVYLREKLPSGEVHGILIYDTSKKEKPVTHLAQNGMFIDEGEDTQLVLFNGNSQERDPHTGQPNILYFDQYTLQTQGMRKEKVRKVKHHERFLPELLFPSEVGLKKSRVLQMIAEGHQRLLSPLYCIVFALAALCSLVLGAYNRRGRVGQIIFAASLSCVFYVVTLMLLNMTAHLILGITLYYLLVSVVIFGGLWSLSPFGPFAGKQKLEGGK